MKLKLIGTRIILRALDKSDATSIFYNAKDKEVSQFNTMPYPYKQEDAVYFINQAQKRLRKKLSYELGIELKKDKRVIGIISLINIDSWNKNAEIGYWLGKNYWRQGLGTEALDLMLQFAFSQLKLERVYARVREPNIPSRKLLEKNGFTCEGKLRKAIFNKGKWSDHLIYSILRNEYKK